MFFSVQITMFLRIETDEKIIAIETSFIFIAWYMNFVFVTILILSFFIYFLKHWKSNVLWIFLQGPHRHFNVLINKNISRIDVFARNVRSIIYFCIRMFSNRISDILCIALFCNFFYNISSFLYLISWLFSIKSVYSWLLRRVFMWSLIHIFSFRYFLRIILHFLFIISNAWSRRLFSLFSFFCFWCFETCS